MPVRNSNSKSKIVILEGEQRLGAAARSSAFMAVEDFSTNAEPVLTIDKIGFGECVLDQGRREDHDVIFFTEQSVPGLPAVRPLICNSTNRKTLMAIYGDLSAACLEGKTVRLYIDPHVRSVGGGYTSGIRIRRITNPAPSVPVQPNPVPICSDCGNPILNAGDVPAEQVLANGRQWFGRDLCSTCQNRLINAQQAGNAQN